MNPLDAIIGFGSSLANYGAQQSQADEAFRKNKELARMQNGFNIAQWERENAYNSPIQQMMRFKQAGLNPNLMYGQQNLSANSPELVGGTPYQSPQANPIDANAVAQLSLLNAQKENIEADTHLKEKEGEGIEADISLKGTQEALNNSMKELNEEQKKYFKEQIPLIRTNVKKAFQEYRSAKINADNLDDFIKAQISKMESEEAKNYVEANDLIQTLQARVNELNARAAQERWSAKTLEKQFDILAETLVQEQLATEIKRNEKEVSEAETSVKGSKGYQWTHAIIGEVSNLVGIVGGVMIGRATAGKAVKSAREAGYNEAMNYNNTDLGAYGY